ncbi:P-loop containing nucleoside triphosphate hydrolase protein [Polychytrium aggregatum]|uniref:P-loop containing nucleoside triphosphate hydrolase protein n=1 Tax=Polychytrium aggregatum TaxID=110093 RepID=UPI0022FEAFE2|nr:P-loop containing nucleoside triphosphate hydrolase protein [Polychytrium aggregatum]KAI9193107.1 P-loop containing nucleoside triphosphate hydrolase protein [Polychytrium aggregatum]
MLVSLRRICLRGSSNAPVLPCMSLRMPASARHLGGPHRPSWVDSRPPLLEQHAQQAVSGLRLFSTCPVRASRSSTTYTFSTKYPRRAAKPKTKKPSSKGRPRRFSQPSGARKPSQSPGSLRNVPGLVLPRKLQLDPHIGTKRNTNHQSTQDLRRPKSKKPMTGSGTRPPAPSPAQKTARALSLEKRRLVIQESIKKHNQKFALEPNEYSEKSVQDLKLELNGIRFETLGLLPETLEAVSKGLGYRRPTEIQALTIPKILAREQDILIAAETGTGKTAAYLIPIMNNAKLIETERIQRATRSGIDSSAPAAVFGVQADGTPIATTTKYKPPLRAPLALVIVPSRELVDQVTSVAKRITHHLKLRVVGMHSKTRAAIIQTKLQSPVDVLVATPSLVERLVEESQLSLRYVANVVVDEADTLFDQEFGAQLRKIVTLIKDAAAKQTTSSLPEIPCRFTFVTATLPRTVTLALSTHFPNTLRLTTPSLHKTLKRCSQQFLYIDGSTTKNLMLLDVLKRSSGDQRIIIFCNTRKSCEAVGQFLRSKGLNAHNISAEMEVDERKRILREFTDKSQILSVDNQFEQEFVRNQMILVSTDLTSRGLDTMLVSHVVLYDFPQTAIDYLHRVGRTARNGGRGRATAIISKKEARLAKNIEAAVKNHSVLA